MIHVRSLGSLSSPCRHAVLSDGQDSRCSRCCWLWYAGSPDSSISSPALAAPATADPHRNERGTSASCETFPRRPDPLDGQPLSADSPAHRAARVAPDVVVGPAG